MHHGRVLAKAAKHKPKSRFCEIAPLVGGLALLGFAGVFYPGAKAHAQESRSIVQPQQNARLIGCMTISTEADAFGFDPKTTQIVCQKYSDFINMIIWNLQRIGVPGPKDSTSTIQLALKTANLVWCVAKPAPLATVFEAFYAWNYNPGSKSDMERATPPTGLVLDCDLSSAVIADVLQCLGVKSSIVLVKDHAILKIMLPNGGFFYMETTPLSDKGDTFTLYSSESDVKDTYKSIIWEGEPSASSWWNFATIAYRSYASGQYARAKSFYLKCLGIMPGDAPAWCAISRCEIKAGNRDGAINAARKAVEIGPQNYEYHQNLGVIYGASGLFADAEKELRQAIKLNPDDGPSFYALGHALRGQGKNAEAAVIFMRARKLGYTGQ
ncbi:Tetratricopeptide repeat protein [Candidatus Anstonella stagnisolia]|nr:Tetratricopeptide repeat protein [Candidatus Anstonella stagnisolia]